MEKYLRINIEIIIPESVTDTRTLEEFTKEGEEALEDIRNHFGPDATATLNIQSFEK